MNYRYTSAERRRRMLMSLAILGVAFGPSACGQAHTVPPAPQTTKVDVAISTPAQPFLMVHYMPWFQSDPEHNNFGWHWTMGHLDPTKIVDGKRQIAAKQYPMLGVYDSDDERLLDCQVALMKFAGFDGPIIDWYGTYDYLDYGSNNHNAQHLVKVLQKANMHFGILYEDEVVMNRLVNDGKLTADQTVDEGKRTMGWAEENWFSTPNYLKLDGHPVVLSFGTIGYFKQDQWDVIFADQSVKPYLFTEYTARCGAVGGFGWPAPDQDTTTSMPHLDWNYQAAKTMPAFIAPAWTRFDDFYAEAGIGKSWGHIDDGGGQVYETTLTRALQSKSPVIQVATWNDWGEGTEIEPSVQFGYRDLETTQRVRRKLVDPKFPYTAADLRLPVDLLALRRKYENNPAMSAKLTAVSDMLLAGNVKQARSALTRITGAAAD